MLIHSLGSVSTNTIPRDNIGQYCLQRQMSCTNHQIEVKSFLRGQHENMNHSYKFQIMAPSNGYCYCTPKNCSDVVQVDPMLATAGSALRAIRVLQVTLSNCSYSCAIATCSLLLGFSRTPVYLLAGSFSLTWSVPLRDLKPWLRLIQRLRFANYC